MDKFDVLKNVPALLALCSGAIALVAAAEVHRGDIILFNASHSVPSGFYLRSPTPPQGGSFVTVRAADVAPEYAALRHFTGEGDRFIKRLAAGPGARVCGDGEFVTVGSSVYTRRLRDGAGRPLPSWDGCHILRDGEVFLMGDTADSFDSRYFGVVTTNVIEGVWTRL